MKIKVPEDRTVPDLKPMTVKRFISELKYPWSAWLDKRGLLWFSYQDETKASYLPGDDHWDFHSIHFEYSIDVSLMQKMLALIKYERTVKQYVLVNGKTRFINGEKYWSVFVLGADGLETTIAYEGELQNFSYSREQLERFADRYTNKLQAVVDTLAVPLDEVLANDD